MSGNFKFHSFSKQNKRDAYYKADKIIRRKEG